LVAPLPRREISRYARNDKDRGVSLTRREGAPRGASQGGPLPCSGVHAKCLFDRSSKLPLDFFLTYPIIIIQNLKGDEL